MASFLPDKDNAKKFFKSGGAFTGLLHDNIKAWKEMNAGPDGIDTSGLPMVARLSDKEIFAAKIKALRSAIRSGSRRKTMLSEIVDRTSTAERKSLLGS